MGAKPKLAVIGAGGWGRLHAENAVTTHDWDVVAYVDRNPEVLAWLQTERDVPASKCFASTDEVFAAGYPDAATISIPNPGRTPVLVQLLKAGVSVLSDKPLAHTASDLRAIGNALAEGGAMLMVGQNYRFDPDVRAMHEIVQSGVYGPLEHVTVHFAINARFTKDAFYKELEGGTLVLVEMGVHHFDMLRYIMACDAVEVFGRCWSSLAGWIKGCTGAQALITFENGAHVTYDADWNTHGKLTDWGAHWTLQFADATIHWEPRTANSPRIMSVTPGIDTGIWEGIVSRYPSAENHMRMAFDEFSDAYLTHRTPECDFRDNIRSLGVSLAIIESSNSGGVVRLADVMSEIAPR